MKNIVLVGKIIFGRPKKDQKQLEDENKALKNENAEFKRQLSQIATDHQSETTKLREQVSELESQLKTLELEKKSSQEIQDSLSQTKLMAELEEENLKLQKVRILKLLV